MVGLRERAEEAVDGEALREVVALPDAPVYEAGEEDAQKEASERVEVCEELKDRDLVDRVVASLHVCEEEDRDRNHQEI